jgi:hypothetical protein
LPLESGLPQLFKGTRPYISHFLGDQFQNESIFSGAQGKGETMPDEESLLNADFWQAVGSALKRRQTDACPACEAGEGKCHWHRFVDHLRGGQDPESFFERCGPP